MPIKTIKLNTAVIREMNLQTFSSREAKDHFVETVAKYTDLLPCEFEVLYAISRYSNSVPGVCWATVETMVNDEHTKVGERAFRKGIKGLREKEIIIVHETRRIRSGGQGTNIYQLNPQYITKLAFEIDVQGVDAGGVQGGRAGRLEADEANNHADRNSVSETPNILYKESTNILFKEYSYSRGGNFTNESEVNSAAEGEKAVRKEVSEGRPVSDEFEEMIDAFDVPGEVAKRLKPYFQPVDLVGVWRYIVRTLENINEKYEDNADIVLKAIMKTVRKYKKNAIRENFEKYLGGTLVGMINDRYERLAQQYQEMARQQWEERARKIYGLDKQEESADETEQEFADSLRDRIRSLYAAYLAQYGDKDRAFEETVAEVAYRENMKTFDARYYVMDVIGGITVPAEVWGDCGGAWA